MEYLVVNKKDFGVLRRSIITKSDVKDFMDEKIMIIKINVGEEREVFNLVRGDESRPEEPVKWCHVDDDLFEPLEC